jgi:C4-dicarboxylate-specific signal transduction histidine kinase
MANSDAALQWLAKDPPNFERARSSVERIAGNCQHASDVIATLRALYQKNASQRVLLDVNRIIREVLVIEREELLSRRVLIELQLSEPTPKVFSDRLQLHQVILNLITNALDAMTEVTDRARVLRVRSEIRGSEALIAIEDSGTGIDRKVANQIFEPFYTTKSQGMGLGLWICQTIIQNHNGRLTMSPGRDHGSIFQIVLPGGSQAASGMGI